jgi:hypothetical protein
LSRIDRSVRLDETVAVKPFDDIPRTLFFVRYIDNGVIGGYAKGGPLKNEYGEPDLEMLDLSIRELSDLELRGEFSKCFSGTEVQSNWIYQELLHEAERRFVNDCDNKDPG